MANALVPARGWHYIRLTERAKKPVKGLRWDQTDTTDCDTVKAWLKKRYNYGVRCGPSGLLVVDEDAPGDYVRWQEDYGVTLPETFTVSTPKGGKHYYFDQGTLGIGNSEAFNQHRYKIDVRGVGGYVVGPDSYTTENKAANTAEGSYKVVNNAPVAQLPDVLAEFLTPDPIKPPPPKEATLVDSSADLRPGDLFDRDHNTPELLAEYLYKHGWQFDHQSGGEIYLTRPGKDSGNGGTVEMHHDRPGLFVFTTSTEFISSNNYNPRRAYRPWHCYAVLEHGGDYKAAARALAVRYGASLDFEKLDTPTAEEEIAEEVSTWEPVDIEPILKAIESGMDITPRPEIGRIGAAGNLFYRYAVNGVYGEAGTGKTFTANAVTVQELQAGNHVLHIDWEAGPNAIINRLLTAGVDADILRQQFHYVQPDMSFVHGGLELIDYAKALKPSLVVIDSTGEAVANEGINPNADEEIARWFQTLPAPLARTGAAVVVLDHAAKSEDSARKGPVGSHRKLAAITGAQYEQKTGAPFSKVQDGYANLVVKKDRHGTYTKNQVVAQLKVEDGATRLELSSPTQTFRPTVVMSTISSLLQTHDGRLDGFNKLHSEIGGKRTITQKAIELLVQEGYVKQTSGRNRAVKYELIKPFSEFDPEDDFL